MELFDVLHYWHWWVIAIVLVILELTVSGAFFFLWLAAAAALTGLVALVVPSMAWEGQLFIFALLTVISLFLWRRFKPAESASDMPALKCLPVEEITTARTRPESESAPTISGSSAQKAGIMEL